MRALGLAQMKFASSRLRYLTLTLVAGMAAISTEAADACTWTVVLVHSPTGKVTHFQPGPDGVPIQISDKRHAVNVTCLAKVKDDFEVEILKGVGLFARYLGFHCQYADKQYVELYTLAAINRTTGKVVRTESGRLTFGSEKGSILRQDKSEQFVFSLSAECK